MKIAGLVKTSTVDFPGRLAAVVFTAGCNFDCFYCHNRQLLGQDLQLISQLAVEEFLQKRNRLLEGVVVSGGEPLLQPALMDFLVRIRRLGYQVKLDTNGSHPGLLRELVRDKLVDYVAVDYKAPWSSYAKVNRCHLATACRVQESFNLLFESGINWEARTTIIPGLTLADLTTMARESAALPAWYWQEYRRPQFIRPGDEDLLAAAILSKECLADLAGSFSKIQPAISLRF